MDAVRSFTIASNQGQIGGGEVMLLAIAQAARESGRDVTVVGPASPGNVIDSAHDLGFRVVALKGDSTLAYMANLRRWSARRTGLLWCNGLRPALATAGQIRRIVHLHQRPEGRLVVAAGLARLGADATVVPSHSMQQAVKGSEVLWNWNSAPLPIRKHRPIPQTGPVTLGFMGRLTSRKGVEILCDAVALLSSRYPNRFRLLVAGESRFVPGAEATHVHEAIARLGGNARAVGWIRREEFFASVDLAVFPSVCAESFGLMASEAMAAKCPFVISDAGALPEVVGAAFPFVARAGSPESLADTIEAATAADWHRLANNLHGRWAACFSPEAGAKRFRSVLDRVDPVSQASPRIVIAHDYLTQRGGAERVVLDLARIFPQAPIVTSVYNPKSTYPEFSRHRVVDSPLGRSRLLRSHFRLGLPLFGFVFDHAPIHKGTDIVLGSSTGYAHGVRTPKFARKLVYCHSPARFLYLQDQYLGKPWWESPKGWILKTMSPALIWWDRKAAASADKYLCNSTTVQKRIKQVYGIDATVVPPPYSLDPRGPQEPVPELAGWEDYFLVVSRLMPYKNVDVVTEAFRQLHSERLVVVGRGPLATRLRASAPGNVCFLDSLGDDQLRWVYAHCQAVIAVSQEDFGLTPVEGFSFGKPCLALHAGGYLDTMVDGVTGWFIDAPTPGAVVSAVEHMIAHPLRSDEVRAHSERFSPQEFSRKIHAEVEDLMTGGAQ